MIPALYERSMIWLYRSRRKVATYAVGLLAFVIAYHAAFGPNGMVVYQHKRTEYKNLEREIKDLQQQNDKIQQQVKALKSDPATIEKEAREQLRYTRPGEMVYILPEQQKPVGQTPAAAENHAPKSR